MPAYETENFLFAGPAFNSCLGELVENFDQAYRRRYDYTAPDEVIEVVTLRLEAYGVVDKPELTARPRVTTGADIALIGSREVWQTSSNAFIETPVYNREHLDHGHCIQGPAIIEQMDSTTLILAGQTARVDPHLNLVIEEDQA